MTIFEYAERFKQLKANYISAVSTEVARTQQMFLDLIKSQILSGLNANGEPLTPSYTNDPFFKSSQSAEAYKRMKERREGSHNALIKYKIFPPKNPDTPNLIISGKFQDNMSINVSGDEIQITSSYKGTNDIQNKYGNIFTPNREALIYYNNMVIIPFTRKYFFG